LRPSRRSLLAALPRFETIGRWQRVRGIGMHWVRSLLAAAVLGSTALLFTPGVAHAQLAQAALTFKLSLSYQQAIPPNSKIGKVRVATKDITSIVADLEGLQGKLSLFVFRDPGAADDGELLTSPI